MRRTAAAVLAAALVSSAAAGGEIALSFGDAPGGAAFGFRVERRAAGDPAFHPIALLGSGVAEFVDRGLPDGATYCYRVRALAAGQASPWSPDVCAVARAEKPSPGVDPPTASPPPVGEAGAEPTPPPSRRIRTSGGWLQVLD